MNSLRKNTLLCAAALTLALVRTASAQQVTLPQGTLLKPLPDFTKAFISYESSKDAAPLPADAPHRATVARTQNILHEEIVDGRGCCADTWYLGVRQYRKPHGGTAWFLSEPARANTAQDSSYDPLPAIGFRNWHWVGPETYVGTVLLGGKECLAFVPEGPGTFGKNTEHLAERLGKAPHVAYVDAESRLPVLQRMGTATQTFRFESLPPGLLTLPADLSAQIRATEEARARLLQAAPRPY